jgi:Coenzyme PQQ synthesis protein D (PqqD)
VENTLPASNQEHAISTATCLALPTHVSLQGLGNEDGGVILNLNSGEMYTINETTLSFLEQLDGKRKIADIAASLVEIFDVDRETLNADLVEVAKGLADESLLVVVDQ